MNSKFKSKYLKDMKLKQYITSRSITKQSHTTPNTYYKELTCFSVVLALCAYGGKQWNRHSTAPKFQRPEGKNSPPFELHAQILFNKGNRFQVYTCFNN
jgi:hypothetical protein